MEVFGVNAKISLRSISKAFQVDKREFYAVQNVSLDIADGEFVCIVGPSGCGKSTLFRMVGGLMEPTEGDIAIRRDSDDRPLTATVFQEESVFPWLTVEQNAAYGIKITRRWDKQRSPEIIDYFLEKTGLLPFRKLYPHQLSGGMKQRLSIARAFAAEPEILLMDEPFAALDEQNKLLLQDELVKLWEGNRSSVMFITHSIEEAVLLGDRVVVMTSSPGRFKEILDIPFQRPRDLQTLRTTPEFVETCRAIWELLREEVLNARDAQANRVKERAAAR